MNREVDPFRLLLQTVGRSQMLDRVHIRDAVVCTYFWDDVCTREPKWMILEWLRRKKNVHLISHKGSPHLEALRGPRRGAVGR